MQFRCNCFSLIFVYCYWWWMNYFRHRLRRQSQTVPVAGFTYVCLHSIPSTPLASRGSPSAAFAALFQVHADTTCRGAQFFGARFGPIVFLVFRRLTNTASQGFRLAITMTIIYEKWTESVLFSSSSSRRETICRPLVRFFRLRNVHCAFLSASEMRAARWIVDGTMGAQCTPSRVVRERVRVATSIQRIFSLSLRTF